MANEFFESEEKKEQSLVVACYPWEWQEVLTVEVAVDLKSRGLDVEYLDLSMYTVQVFKRMLKFFLRSRSDLSKKARVLQVNQIEIIEPKMLIFFYKIGNFFLSSLRLMPKNTLNSRWDVVYPGLVDITGNLNVSMETHRKLVRKSLIQDFFFNKILRSCLKNAKKYDRVVIVNGRFPLNRASLLFFTNQNQKVELVEFGSTRSRFQLYSVSPHSIQNRLELFREFSHQIQATPQIVNQVGSQFFEGRRKFDKQANFSWTKKMKEKKIPNFASSKVCTFFPTSEREFVGVRDTPKVGEFPNQFSALEALISHLGPAWKIFVRRHPIARDSEGDPEAKLWERFEKFDNVEIIEPGSDIDSYELGMKSNLVAHFNSFIGPELIFAGHKSVVTLGHTQWEDLDPKRHLFTAQRLRAYLSNSLENDEKVDVRPLGYYMATFGTDFKCYEWNQVELLWTSQR